MQADFSIELGAEDEVMECPWAAAGDVRYYDLKRHPGLVASVPEAFGNPALQEFLAGANSASSLFETAKCDCWFSQEISEEEKTFGQPAKFGSYVDLIFSAPEERASFQAHERWAQRISELLKRAPEIGCAAEFCVRRCYTTPSRAKPPRDGSPGIGPEEGFGMTFYLFGYGEDEAAARAR